jgi:putative ABC transport system substrate-binding protein
VLDVREVQVAARALGLEAATFEILRAEDIAPTFEALTSRVDALYVAGDPLVNTNRIRINSLALGARLPTMHGYREYVEAGGLMSYGPNVPDQYRRAADYVDKILRGAKPTDIGRAADQVRSRDQLDHRQGARPENPRVVPVAR